MIINTTIVLKDLKGRPLKDGESEYTLGEAIANILVSGEMGGKKRTYALVQRLMNETNPDVDAADLALITSTLESTKTFSVLVAAQALTLLEGMKQ